MIAEQRNDALGRCLVRPSCVHRALAIRGGPGTVGTGGVSYPLGESRKDELQEEMQLAGMTGGWGVVKKDEHRERVPTEAIKTAAVGDLVKTSGTECQDGE